MSVIMAVNLVLYTRPTTENFGHWYNKTDYTQKRLMSFPSSINGDVLLKVSPVKST